VTYEELVHRRYRKAVEFGQNGVGGLCPDERFGTIVVLSDVGVDSGLQVGDRAKDTATDALSGHLGKEVLDGVEPRGRSRGEAARLSLRATAPALVPCRTTQMEP